MVDPNALIGGGLAALASKDLLTKLLGPTADYIGGEIKDLVEKLKQRPTFAPCSRRITIRRPSENFSHHTRCCHIS